MNKTINRVKGMENSVSKITLEKREGKS